MVLLQVRGECVYIDFVLFMCISDVPSLCCACGYILYIFCLFIVLWLPCCCSPFSLVDLCLDSCLEIAEFPDFAHRSVP